MTFLNPLFAWGFLSLAVILVLYLLKRKYEARQIPSTFLWRKTGIDMSANRPLQRLKRNILLPVQLMMAAVLVLALMRPILPGDVGGEIVMIFDLSASMQASDGSQSRLDDVVDAATNIINGLDAGDALTLLAAGSDTQQLLTRSTDRNTAHRVLQSLVPSNSSGDLSGAVSLAMAMKREVEGLNIIVFSDNYIPESSISVCNSQMKFDNRAIIAFTAENGTGYARIANYGAETEITLACYAEGTLCDARTLRLPAGESAGATFAIPDCRWGYVEIREPDAIQSDNRLYFAAKLDSSYTVAMSGEGSVFLERAIALRDDIQIIRTTENDLINTIADLYVYGSSPLIFSKDADQTNLQAGAVNTPEGTLTLSGRNEFTSGLTLSDVAVRSYRPLTGGRPLMTIDGKTVMATDSRSVVLGFDIHDTNLPMKYDFPILIQNILSVLLPRSAADIGDGNCGEHVDIPVPSNCESIRIETPSGNQMQLFTAGNSEFSGAEDGTISFSDTCETGLYTLFIYDGENTGERFFSLRMPLSESDVRNTASSIDANGEKLTFEKGRELTYILTALFLVLLLIEWVVRQRVA